MKNRKAISIPLLILFLSICLSDAYAKPIDTLVAKRVALNFMAAKTQDPSRNATTAKLIYTGKYQNSSTSRTANCFYIFSTSNGFVIVSADDRIEPILGYSTEGQLDLHGMPVNMEEILDGYTQEIKLFLQNATPEPNAATEKWRKLADNTYMIHEKAAVIGPLLKTRWNQDSPYNLHCPDSNGQGQHALTGCVATAMAQIIRYWEYPAQGVGTKTYTCNNASSSNNYYGDYGTLTVNFGIGSYNYNYMPEVIDYNSSSAQINAVARLSYHCGVSVQMTYGIYASAASTSNAVNALSNYFKYSTTYNTLSPEFKSKSNYSDADWVNMIKSELNAWRPVIYSGSGSGGHSFICDGYDNQGYFHFNWGWGGYLDGYFLLTALTPTGHNYTLDQAAIFYIQGKTPLIRTSADELSFIAPIGNHSNSQILSLCGVALSNNIVASVPAGFQISTDNIQYGNSLTLGTGVSQIYIRYAPTIATIGVENAVLTLSSGSTTKTIALTGRTYDLDCNPPQNLQGSAELQDVQLSWQAPTQDIHTYTFSLDSSVNYGRRVGFGVTSYTMVNRLCEPELIPYHQKLLKKISFYVIPASYTSFKIVVYRGGKYQNGGYSEGTLVLEQSANITSSGWNTVTLNSPVVIDAEQELWYGVLLNCPSNAMPIPVGTNPAIVGQGDLVRINGSWLKLSNFNGYEYNIPFKISIEDSPAAITNYTIERNNTPVGTTTGTQFHEQQNTSGAYTYNVTANWDNGCSATSEDITVHVITDCEATMGDTTASVCDSFNWYEHSDITSSGNYSHTIVGGNVHGCDSIVTLHLTVNPTYYLPENVTVTQGSLPYTWHGRTFLESATAYDSLLTGAGCDSVHYLNLTVTPFSVVTDTPIAFCQGGSQVWRGRTLTQAGDYRDTVLAENNIYTVTVTVNPTYYIPENVTVTQGSLPYLWHGRTFHESATAYDSLLTGAGCDSVHYLNLTVTPFSVVTDTPIAFCQGGSQVWRGRTLTQAVDYRDTVLAENNIYTVTVTVNPTYYIPENVTVTQGSLPYLWHGRTFLESATAYDSLLTGAGCDSVHFLNLTVTPFSVVTDTPIAFCQGGSQVWRGRTLTQAGDYRDTVLAENNIYTVTVTVNPTYYIPENVTVTQGSLPYTWHGRTFYGSATAYDSLLTGAGCDSVHYLNLTVTPFSIVEDEPIAFCQGGSQVWRGRTLTQAGDYRDTVLAENTIHTVTVTVNPTYYIPENVTVTQGSLPYTWHGRAFHESATAYDSLLTGAGCDSVHYLNLTVTPFNIVEDEPISFCQGGSQIWRGRTLTQAGDYRDTVLNENTIHTVTVTVNPTYFLPENVTVTQGSLPYLWHGRTFLESATAYDSLLTGAGCDSVHFLNLTVTPFSVVTDTPIAFCQGGSQVWRGRTLTQAGDYRDTVLAENNIYTVTVTVNPTYYIPKNVTVTQGSLPYTWHGRTFYGSATAYDSLLTGAGCDSVHYLNLTVTPFSIVEDELIAFCQGGSQIWRGRTLTQAGNYRDTVLAENTIYTVVVTVNPTYYIPENVTVTQGSLPYTWHGRTFYGNATAYDSLLTGAGCDSVHYLNLTVTAFNIVEDEPIAFCLGGSQIWRGRTLTQAGNYRDTALAENTIYTVTVTVNPTYYIPENVTVTQGSLPYTWHGRTFYGNATAYDSLLTGAGCDSVHYLNLSVTPFSIVEDEPIAFCQGGSQIWRGRTLTQEGDYRDTVLTENTIYTVTVTVNPTYAVDTTVTITTNELPYHFVSGQIDTTFEEGTPDSSTLNFHLSTIHGCDSTITLHLTILTGIVHHPMEQTLRAFPNPTSGQLTVTGSADFTQIQLFDAYGRQIKTYSVEENQIEIDLHGLADGVYFIKAMRHKQMVGAIRIIKNGQ